MCGLNGRHLRLILREVILRWLSYTDDETHSRMIIVVSLIIRYSYTRTRLTLWTVAEGEKVFAMQQ